MAHRVRDVLGPAVSIGFFPTMNGRYVSSRPVAQSHSRPKAALGLRKLVSRKLSFETKVQCDFSVTAI